MSRAGAFRAFLVSALLVAPEATTADKWTKGRVSLFVFARTVEPSTDSERTARAKPAKDAFDVADRQLASTEQDLKRRHGGKRNLWPEDARATFEQAGETRRQAFHRWLDSFQTQKDLDEWTEALRSVLFNEKVEHTHRAGGPEDADLTVEVVRAPSRARNSLFLRIAPGGRLDASRLGGTQFEWRSANISEVHAFSPSEPHWEIEALGDREFRAHGYANSGIGGFIRRYYDLFAAAGLRP